MASSEARSEARYVAIITDGNGRWAQRRVCRRWPATRPARTSSRRGCAMRSTLGIEELTVYSFSTENWSRSPDEVAGLMDMFARRIEAETPELMPRGCACASSAGAPIRCRASSSRAWSGRSETTRDNTRITLFVAFNYGGRAEIVDAARTFTGTTEEEFRAHLYAPDMHDPDLIIRTSGEQRISNYLLWQAAYSELVFRDELWPDFSREAFEQSLEEFAARRRRFGGR